MSTLPLQSGRSFSWRGRRWSIPSASWWSLQSTGLLSWPVGLPFLANSSGFRWDGFSLLWPFHTSHVFLCHLWDWSDSCQPKVVFWGLTVSSVCRWRGSSHGYVGRSSVVGALSRCFLSFLAASCPWTSGGGGCSELVCSFWGVIFPLLFRRGLWVIYFSGGCTWWSGLRVACRAIRRFPEYPFCCAVCAIWRCYSNCSSWSCGFLSNRTPYWT